LLIAPDVVWRGNHGGRTALVRGQEPLVRRELEKRFKCHKNLRSFRKFLRRVQNARRCFRIGQAFSFVNLNHLSAANAGDEFNGFSFAQIDGRYQSAVNLVTDSKDMLFHDIIPPGHVAGKNGLDRMLHFHFPTNGHRRLALATGTGRSRNCLV
jgi:hypothetical protein